MYHTLAHKGLRRRHIQRLQRPYSPLRLGQCLDTRTFCNAPFPFSLENPLSTGPRIALALPRDLELQASRRLCSSITNGLSGPLVPTNAHGTRVLEHGPKPLRDMLPRSPVQLQFLLISSTLQFSFAVLNGLPPILAGSHRVALGSPTWFCPSEPEMVH